MFSRTGSLTRHLPLSRSQVEKFFEPSVSAIVKGIKEITAETDPANTVKILFVSSDSVAAS